MINCSNPLYQYSSHKKEIDAAIRCVLNKGRYILGDEVKAFENEFSDYVGVPYGIGVGSGTEALHIALVACGIGRSDEVITPSHTAVATVAAIELTGAKAIFADIDPMHYTMNPDMVKSLVTPRTKAIVPVHIYGHPVDLNPILKIAAAKKIYVIEDCAQAHGAKYMDRQVGSFGDAACFSFYPTKNMGAIGDGGIVVTKDRKTAENIRSLREYGWLQHRISYMHGWNTRLDELQAAILRVKLKYLEEDNRKRIAIAEIYNNELAGTGIGLPSVKNNCRHVYHLYVARTGLRDRLKAALGKSGISTLVHYDPPVHLQPAYRGKSPGRTMLRHTERAAREVISLPMYPELKKQEVKKVCSAIRKFLKGATSND